jgi:hypothetical protein
MLHYLLESEAFFGVLPGEALEQVLEVLTHPLYGVLEDVPEWLSVCGAETLEVRVFLVGSPKGWRLHDH